jgi:hypothetical protein
MILGHLVGMKLCTSFPGSGVPLRIEVEYDLEYDAQKGKYKAKNVTGASTPEGGVLILRTSPNR